MSDQTAKIWRELFRLGLTKKSIRRYLHIPNNKAPQLWRSPNSMLTFNQLRHLAALVAPHYTFLQLAELLVSDYVPPKSLIAEDFYKALNILMSEDGIKEWDNFIKRKNPGSSKSVLRSKAAKFDSNRTAYKRLCSDNVEHEHIVEFVTERERLESIKSVSPIVPPVDNSPSVKI